MSGKIGLILGMVVLCGAAAGVVAVRRANGPVEARRESAAQESAAAVPFPPRPMEEPEYRYRPGDVEPVIVFFRPGIRQPRAVPAEQAGLPDDTRVIGVVVAGKARAYVASAMSEPRTHVVNDRIGGRYISVAFCDVQQCATAYCANDAGDEPLELWVAGWDYDEIVLLGKKGPFRQKSDAAPYPHVPCVLTTWGQWRRQHPDTDVVVRLADQPQRPASSDQRS